MTVPKSVIDLLFDMKQEAQKQFDFDDDQATRWILERACESFSTLVETIGQQHAMEMAGNDSRLLGPVWMALVKRCGGHVVLMKDEVLEFDPDTASKNALLSVAKTAEGNIELNLTPIAEDATAQDLKSMMGQLQTEWKQSIDKDTRQ